MDKPYETLPPHMLFLASDYRENFDTIIRDLSLPANPSLYIHAPTRPSQAPLGQDTWPPLCLWVLSENEQVGLNCGMKRGNLSSFSKRRHYGFGIASLKPFTPISWRKRYNLMAPHGLCPTMQLGYFRPDFNISVTATCISRGQYASRQSMPTAMVSGRQSAQRIMDDLNVWVPNEHSKRPSYLPMPLSVGRCAPQRWSVGMSVTSLENTLCYSCDRCSIFFAIVSLVYFNKFNFTSPLQAASLPHFIAMDFFVVAC
jgi:hypothetical protein